MKAVILSGGKGTRLRPITYTSAKQLVPVANKPILFYAIEAVRDAGIREIGIVVGDTAPDVMAAVGDGSHWDVEVTYLPQEAPLGLAHAVGLARDFVGDEPFVVFLGDNLIRDGITSFVAEFQASAADAQILLAHVPNAEQFGVAELDASGHVVRLVEKPTEPASDLALVGVYLFGPAIFAGIDTLRPSWRGELEITDAIQWLIDNGYTVKPHIISGWWKDTGRLADLLEANRFVLDALTPDIAGELDASSRVDGRVRIAEGTRLVNSTVRGPAVIGSGCDIVDSYIGPYSSVHDGCRVEGSEIEHSILLPGARILRVRGRISDSLLGRNAVVRNADSKPAAYHFMLGDNSEVDIV